ncbi:tRNA dihydrouridine synthase DusB [uncultured Roseobacter sp.]|uniref:tRNA dihydrouridine synthase DusB n=1 Tax=uncultured Roseobacter sp. TaxID=114847 RepID=UPI00260947DC|nr:tRNA dihydrouridine synthase DusB [uncultured Roseobacter sp.]
MPAVTPPFDLTPPVMLAPMAGITDLPFRNLVASFGAGLVVSEMVASHDMLNARPGSREKAELGLGHVGTAVQLAGREAAPMAEAARMVEGQGAQVIDINMGCPAKKVTQGYSGSALMRTPDHALTLIEAVVKAVKIPVTLKTRLGWDDRMRNAPEIARRAEAAGITMITIHGRTRCQFYKGAADWAAIHEVKNAVAIPVIANGDIIDSRSARRAMALSGADGIMVGRGARGKPWLLAEIAHALFGTAAPSIPSGADFAAMVQAHYEAMIAFYGPELGLRVSRKHLGWYMDTCKTPDDLRRAVLTGARVDETLSLIGQACMPSNLVAA